MVEVGDLILFPPYYIHYVYPFRGEGERCIVAFDVLIQATQSLQAGRPGEAVAPLREAARWLPGNAAILHDLGLACLECGYSEWHHAGSGAGQLAPAIM